MHAKLSACLLVTFVVLTGCSDSGDGDDSESGTGPASGSEASTDGETEATSDSSEDDSDGTESLPGEEELAAGLLTIDDVPTGWAEVPEDDNDEGPLCDIEVDALLGLDEDSLPSAGVIFAEDADTGPGVGEEFGFVPEGRGAEVIPLTEQAFNECEGDEINGLDVTVSELSFDDLGDDSYAVRVHLEDPDSGQSLDIDTTYVVVDDFLMVVFALDQFGDQTELLAEFAPLALQRATDALL